MDFEAFDDKKLEEYAARARAEWSGTKEYAEYELQDVITKNYYTCTNEVLASLGQMYTANDEFRQNIDSAGGDGTAAFVSRAIAEYCK